MGIAEMWTEQKMPRAIGIQVNAILEAEIEIVLQGTNISMMRRIHISNRCESFPELLEYSRSFWNVRLTSIKSL